jgi:hypothetical protein
MPPPSTSQCKRGGRAVGKIAPKCGSAWRRCGDLGAPPLHDLLQGLQMRHHTALPAWGDGDVELV